MQPPNFSHEGHRGGKYFNNYDRYEERHSNSLSRTADCGNRPYSGRFPVPYRGSRTPFRFRSWGCGAPFRGSGPSSFRAPFRGRPPPPCAPRGRPPYSFRPQLLPTPSPPNFGRAGYWGSCGGFNSSQCYQGQIDRSNGAQVERGASPQGGGSKLTSMQTDTWDELLHQDEDYRTAPMEHEISAVGTKHLPRRCRESDMCKLKHMLPSPTGQYANCNGSPAKRIKAYDTKNAAKVHVCSDLSSRQHACTSRAKSLDRNTANTQLGSRGSGEADGKPNYCMNSVAKPSVPYTQPRSKELAKGPPATAKTNGKANSTYKLKSVVHVPLKQTVPSLQAIDGKCTVKERKSIKEMCLSTSSDTVSLPTSKGNVVNSKDGSSAVKASLHDQHCDNRGENSNLELHTHSVDSQQCIANSAAACIRGASPDSTTHPCSKLYCQESTGDISSSDGAAPYLPQLVSTSSGIAAKEVLPSSVTANLLHSATTNYVGTKCLGEDAHKESLHCSAGLCSGTLSTCQDELRAVVAPVPSAPDNQIDEKMDAHIGNSGIPRQPSTDIAGSFIVNPLASFLESGGSGIAAVQKWLAVTSPCTNSIDFENIPVNILGQRDEEPAEEPQHNVHLNSAYALKNPEQENVSSVPASAMLQDVDHCQMPGMSTTGPIMLHKMTDCGMSAASDPAGKIDSDVETASFASTESEDEDCVIVKCENFTHQPCDFQQCSDAANPRIFASPSGSGFFSTHTSRPPPPASFAMYLEDVLFELECYTALCLLDFCKDPVAKKQVYTLYLKGQHTNAKPAYMEKMKKIVRAAVERKRMVWKCSTGVLRKLAKLHWTFPREGSVPRIRELHDIEKH